ncbi:MAG TPA: beta-ketoacyl synthase chain length factor [Usitatibacter sp.]|nr:beta-ketoacyl synthase chain length factor [Usitatibacter sp.]
MKLSARIEGVGLVGPGLASWREARPILAGSKAYAPQRTVIPSPDALPPVERRRAGKCVRMALAAGLAAAEDAGRAPQDLAAIFTSSTGDGEILHAICETLASEDREISPTRFHNSVHNAPAGYWGIATGAMLPSDCLGAFDASFGAGLIEALGRLAADPSVPVLLIAYDAPYPEPLFSVRPVPDSFGVGLVMSAAAGGRGHATLSMETASRAATRLADRQLEAMRVAIPAARSLPLLALLAGEGTGEAVLDYLDGLPLAVAVAR